MTRYPMGLVRMLAIALAAVGCNCALAQIPIPPTLLTASMYQIIHAAIEGPPTAEFAADFPALIPTNSLYRIFMSVTASSGNSGSHGNPPDGGGRVMASVDPSVEFAPGFNSTGYTLAFSPDPVPLPAAMWLMFSGLGGLGVFARRKRAGA